MRRSIHTHIQTLESRCYLSATFSGPTNFTGVDSVTAITAADFNGGGVPDIAIAGLDPSSSTPVVGVYLNTAGSFGTPTLFPFTGTPAGITTGDFTGNGKQDIAVVDSSTNNLDVFLGDGAGNFTPGAGAAFGGTSGDTVAVSADFNGDGKSDIAVVDPLDNQVVVLFSTGNVFGSFAIAQDISVPSPIDVIAADFSDNGHPDLAILSSNGSVYVALNQGTGTFGTPTAYSVGSGLSPTSMAAANLSGNSMPDIVVASSTAGGNGAITVLPNQSGGVFGTANIVGTIAADPLSILSGNFTGSDNADLAVIDASGGLTILPGNGNGTFGAVQSVFTNQLSLGPQAVAADLNGDGLSDIAYADSKGGFSELINTSPGAVATSPLVPKLLSPVPITTLVAGQKIKAIHQTVKLTNSGSTKTSGSTTINLTFSSSPSGAVGDPVIATLTVKKLALKPGKSKTFSLTIKSIPPGQDGAYFIRATVVDSSSNSNAVASAGTVNIVPATIDLTGSFISTPISVKAKHHVAFTFTVINQGTIAAVGPLTVDISTSDVAGVDSTTTPFDDFTKAHVHINPGGKLRIHISKTIPADVPSPFFLIVLLDPNDMFNDVNLTNNQFASTGILVV